MILCSWNWVTRGSKTSIHSVIHGNYKTINALLLQSLAKQQLIVIERKQTLTLVPVFGFSVAQAKC